MLDGVTPFPAEFAARYRALGYWEDRPLFDGFTAALAAYADRVAVVDEAGPVTYRQLGERSERLARVLLDWDCGRWTGSSSSCRTPRCSPTCTSRCCASGPPRCSPCPGTAGGRSPSSP